MNGMTYMRGSRKDYDDWARLGNVGWSYRDVLPYFIRSEDNQQVNNMDYGYHGVGGPLTVMQFPYHPPLSFALLEAGKELGNIYNLNRLVFSQRSCFYQDLLRIQLRNYIVKLSLYVSLLKNKKNDIFLKLIYFSYLPARI